MRVTRYNASDAYYPQTLSMLRLDRPPERISPDPALAPLEGLFPVRAGREPDPGDAHNLLALVRRLQAAELSGNEDAAERLRSTIAQAATASTVEKATETAEAGQEESEITEPALAADLGREVQECFALRTSVNSQAAVAVAVEGGGSSALLIERANEQQARLGLRDLEVVADLPVISSAFGYTRRAFQPTYQELGAERLPTEVRVFPTIDHFAAQRVGRPELVGTFPVLAREGEHEGLYLSLDPRRVMTWLRENDVSIAREDLAEDEIVSLLRVLEPVDRYYDNIWECTVRRWVFGLVHTLSHVVMRSISRFAGLERTSIGEYVFLPLLGSVVYDNSSAFQLGGIRTLARDNLMGFLDFLAEDGTACLYDPDCIDHAGACHGCIQSPEICCRVFNHGLSRSFLVGGHSPWSDVTSESRIIGFWELPPE